MRTHMPTSGDVTPERRSRSESMRLITEMSFLFHAVGFGSFAAISTWSAFSQSRQSSTSTSMSIRVTIAQQWSLAHATTKSSFIWIHATSLPVKAYGDCSSLACMRSSLTSLDFMSIFQTSRQSLGMQQTLKIFNKSLNTKEPRTQPSLAISKPMPDILKHANCCIKTSHLNSSGIKKLSSGLQDRGVSLLDACTMLIQVQESASIFVLSSLLSKVLHLLRIFVVLMVVTLFPPFMLHVWQEDYWRTITNGDNVFKKPVIWQLAISYATSLLPSFAIALHQILWPYGWNSESTSAMTFTMPFIHVTSFLILHKTKCLTMASTSSIVSSVMATSHSRIGHLCLFHNMTGLQLLETG